MGVERMFETGVVGMTTMVSTDVMAPTGMAVTGAAVTGATSRADILDRPRVRRRPTSSRRGPIAVPVSGTRRPGGVPAPTLAAGSRVHGPQAHGRAGGSDSDTWEWTDRGLAVVMGLGLMVVLAALVAIVTVTLDVTSGDDRAADQVSAVSVQP